jgi:hypothetical protein
VDDEVVAHGMYDGTGWIGWSLGAIRGNQDLAEVVAAFGHVPLNQKRIVQYTATRNRPGPFSRKPIATGRIHTRVSWVLDELIDRHKSGLHLTAPSLRRTIKDLLSQ